MIQAKLQVYMWLGLTKHKSTFYAGLPRGYEMSHELRNSDRPNAMPPTSLRYVERQVRDDTARRRRGRHQSSFHRRHTCHPHHQL